MVVDEIGLQAEGSEEGTETVEPPWRTAEQTVEHQDERHGEGDVDHPFHEQGEPSVGHLLQIDTRGEGGNERDEYQPDTGSVDLGLPSDNLPAVDADEEDRHATPEYLDVPHGLVQRTYPLHQHAPEYHQHRQPAIDGMAPDQSHVGRCPEVEHHDGGDVPEGQFVVQPEVPVDGDVAYQVDEAALRRIEAGYVVEGCHQEPGGIDAQQAPFVELPYIGISDP